MNSTPNFSPAIPTEEPVVSPYGTEWTRWIRPTILSLLLIFLDVGGIFSYLFGAFLILVYLPRSLLAKKYAACRKERLIRFAVYLTAVGVVMIQVPISKLDTEERAKGIIVAVEKYKATNGMYPDRLEQLTPQFIAEVPKAKIGFTEISFTYIAGNRPKLMYLSTPPFGRRTYNFETKSWGFID